MSTHKTQPNLFLGNSIEIVFYCPYNSCVTLDAQRITSFYPSAAEKENKNLQLRVKLALPSQKKVILKICTYNL